MILFTLSFIFIAFCFHINGTGTSNVPCFIVSYCASVMKYKKAEWKTLLNRFLCYKFTSVTKYCNLQALKSYMWKMELWLKESQRLKVMPIDNSSKGTLINILNLDKGGVSSPWGSIHLRRVHCLRGCLQDRMWATYGVLASPEEHTEGFSARGITRPGALKHIKPFRKPANWVSYLQGSHSRP